MAEVDGEWDCLTRTPMGDQKSVLTVRSDGGSFTGTNAGPLGSLDIIDGKLVGNTLNWKMKITVPFPMTLDCQATVTGDRIEGGITAGAFGTSPMTGTRKR